ncbi:MAG: helix-turn-helix domain-containing protein, partial [Microcystaceae cyanobacterium]
MDKLSPSQVEKLKEIGIYLRQKRLECSMSLEQIAANTRIRLALLRALEEGQFDQLPELIYVQGFIRRYGQMLQVDGETLVKSLSQKSDEPPSESPVRNETLVSEPPAQRMLTRPTPSPRPIQSRSTGFKKIYGLFALILLGAVGGALYLLSRSPVSESVSQPKDQSPVKTDSTPSPSIAPKTLNSPFPKPSISPSPQVPKQGSPLSATIKLEDSSWLKVI